MSIDDLLKFVFSLAKDHKPDGWPAIQMQEITPLAEEIVRLRAENEALKASQNSIRAQAVRDAIVYASNIDWEGDVTEEALLDYAAELESQAKGE